MPRRRPPAGQDPLKRQQILDGAQRCFLREGFELASMSDIATEAGVSKGTLYVYFADKEDLFADLIDAKRAAFAAAAGAELDPARPLEQALKAFAMALAERMTSDEVIRAQRMVLGVVETMPKLAARFFAPDAASARTVLLTFFAAKAARGEVRIPDHELAAAQFVELAMAGLFKSRLFNNRSAPPTRAEMAAVTESAVAMFVRFYGTGEHGGDALSQPPAGSAGASAG